MLCINNAQIIIMQCCSSRLQVMGGGVVLVSTYAGFAPRMIDTYLKFIFECFNTSFCSHKHTEQLQDKCKNILLGLHIWIMHVLCIEFRKTAPPFQFNSCKHGIDKRKTMKISGEYQEPHNFLWWAYMKTD